MKQISQLMIVLMTLLITPVLSYAFEETGSATINTSEYGSFDENKKVIMDKAIEAACLNALDKYTDTFSTARLTNYDKVKDTIEYNVRDFVNCSDPIDENLDFATNEFSVVIKAKINTDKIDKKLQDASAINNSDEPMDIVLLVFTRQVDSVKQKDDKVTKIDQTKTSVDVDQTEASTDTDTSISSSSTETNKTTTGGSTVSSSEEINYKVGNDYFDTIVGGMSDPLNEAGYELIEADYIIDDEMFEAMMEDLSEKGKMSGDTKKEIATILIDEEIPYFIEGIFDIGRQEIDPATGLSTVTVALKKASFNSFLKNGKWKKRPKSIANVGDVQTKGKGTNPAEAISNALGNITNEVARLLVDKANAKGVE